MVTSNGLRTLRSWKWPLVCITAIAFVLAGRTAAQEQAEIIVRNGLIVTAEGRMEADVRIRGEKIAEIGRDLLSSAGGRGRYAHSSQPGDAGSAATQIQPGRLRQRIGGSIRRRCDHDLQFHPHAEG